MLRNLRMHMRLTYVVFLRTGFRAEMSRLHLRFFDHQCILNQFILLYVSHLDGRHE